MSDTFKCDQVSHESNTPSDLPGQPLVLSRVPDIRRERPARLVVVESVYHQPTTGSPSEVTCRFGRFLKSDELPYSRIMSVGEAWRDLDAGWVDGCGHLVVENLEGRKTQPQFLRASGTYSDPDRTPVLVVEMALADDDGVARQDTVWLIEPEESFRGHPGFPVSRLRVRCRESTARISVTVYPE